MYPLHYLTGGALELDDMTSQLLSFSVRSDDEAEWVEVKTHTRLSPPILAWGYNVELRTQFFPTAALSIKVHVRPSGPHPATVPRVGT